MISVAPAENLPFENGSVKRYRAERVYSFLKDPAVALGEARRVLSPEGRILLMDLDWETWIVDSDSQGVTRAIVRAFAETIPQKWMGRRLYSLLRDAGFADITVEVHTLPFTDFEQTRPILVSFAQAAVAASAIFQVRRRFVA